MEFNPWLIPLGFLSILLAAALGLLIGWVRWGRDKDNRS